MIINSIQEHNNTPAFNGVITKYITTPARYQERKMILKMLYNESGSILSQPTQKIRSSLKNKSLSRIKIFDALVELYDCANYYRPKSEKENSDIVFNIFNLIKNPHHIHHNIINQFNGSCEILEKIFTLSKTKKDLKYVLSMLKNDSSIKTENKHNIIIGVLESNNKEKYIDNPKEYSSYLLLNKKDKDVIKKLDKLISENKYQRKDYDVELMVDYNKQLDGDIKKSVKELKKYYTPERANFFETLYDKFIVYRDNCIGEKTTPIILDMYKTTTEDNKYIREYLIRYFEYTRKSNPTQEENFEDLIQLQKLFNRIDEDKNTYRFVGRALRNELDVSSPGELNEILDIIPAKKAIIFYKELSKIVEITPRNKRAEAIRDNIEKPLFAINNNNSERVQDAIKYGFIKKDSVMKKFADKITSLFKRFRYQVYYSNREAKMIKEGSNTTKSDVIKTEPIVQTVETETPKSIVKTAISSIEKPTVAEQEPLQTESIIQEVKNDITNVPANTASVEVPNIEKTINLVSPEGDTVPVKFVNKIKESAQERKIRLSKEVNDYVKRILGQKTYEKQIEGYQKNVTKMRLTLLPEIFESIKDTRAINRKEGKSLRTENKDALKLYQLINGRNRKLIRYMLKQKNAENNRIFNVKDIIQQITNAETYIAKSKKENPEFKVKETKEYYNSIFNDMVEKYGKLKPAKRNKKVSK